MTWEFISIEEMERRKAQTRTTNNSLVELQQRTQEDLGEALDGWQRKWEAEQARQDVVSHRLILWAVWAFSLAGAFAIGWWLGGL